jgi:hypothetical protein
MKKRQVVVGVVVLTSALLFVKLGTGVIAPAAHAVTITKPKATVKRTATTKPKSKPSTPSAKTGPTQVEVNTAADSYSILFARPVPGSSWELPVAIAKGNGAKTVLTDERKQLPTDRYRVESFSSSDPGDVDGDGVDDLTELASPPSMNALSAVTKLDPADGVAIVVDRASFEQLSYQGDDVARDSYLAGLEYVKFYITKADTPRPLVYVMNTETWRAHPMFAQAVGIGSGRGRGSTPGEMRGDVTYYPKAMGPDGTLGLYRFAFQPNDSYSFAEISVAFEVIANQMPFLAPKLAYFPMQAALPVYEREKKLYQASRVPVVLEAQLVN